MDNILDSFGGFFLHKKGKRFDWQGVIHIRHLPLHKKLTLDLEYTWLMEL